jgi:hypothetical protein
MYVLEASSLQYHCPVGCTNAFCLVSLAGILNGKLTCYSSRSLSHDSRLTMPTASHLHCTEQHRGSCPCSNKCIIQLLLSSVLNSLVGGGGGCTGQAPMTMWCLKFHTDAEFFNCPSPFQNKALY